MEEEKSPVDVLLGDVKDYVNTRIDLLTLKAAEKSATAISGLVAGIILLAIFLFFILFASIALAMGLSQLLDSPWSGFIIVAGVYLLAGILIALNREKWIQEPLSNMVIKQVFKPAKDEQPEH